MAMQLNPPPGWPPVPADWTPPPGWQPDPSWPPPPPGWQLWVDTSAPTGGNDSEAGRKGRRRHPTKRIVIIIAGSVLAVILVLAIIGGNTGGGGSGGGSPSATSILQADGYTPNPGLLSANVVVRLDVGLASPPLGNSPPLSTAAGLDADQNVEVVLVFQSPSQASAYDQNFQITGTGTDTVSGSVVTITGSSDDFDFDCGATGVPQCTPI
jgi:hypothetical protein